MCTRRRQYLVLYVIVVHAFLSLLGGSVVSLSIISGRSNRNIRLDMRSSRTNNNEDHNNNDSYKYVHPAIREVLVMEPDSSADDFLGSKNKTNTVLVNADNYTINWNVLEEFVKWEKTKAEIGAEVEATAIASLDQQEINISEKKLISLASQCELAIFRNNSSKIDNRRGVPLPIRGVLKMIPQKDEDISEEERGAQILIATLLALNMVENSMRHLVGKQRGSQAPLLKDMIEIIASRKSETDHNSHQNATLPPKVVASVLRTLLLPQNNGINLRNLLWHGFLSSIHRRWFALSISLLLSLDNLTGSSSFGDRYNDDTNDTDLERNLQTISIMRQHKALVTILDHGKCIRTSCEMLTNLEVQIIKSDNNIIPRSHIELLRVAFKKYINYPIIFASVVGPLIEHTLRILWCNENRENKYIAESGSYYVTLDGHGQRNKHEIMIMPFFSSSQLQQQLEVEGTHTGEGIKNRLVYRLGGPTMAFLVDMFLSPSGGPNIRASVAHGMFNRYLFEELCDIETREDAVGHNNTFKVEDMTNALISVLHILCDDGRYDISCENNPNYKRNVALSSYRPCFSFSALILIEIENMMNKMKPFYQLIHDGCHLKYSTNGSHQSELHRDVTKVMATMSQSIEIIIGMRASIRRGFGTDKSRYTYGSYFRDSLNNLSASECGAAKLLLSEVSIAASSSLKDLNDGIAAFQCDMTQLSSRRRKQISQKCDIAKLTLDFYSFTVYCALLYIERRQCAPNTTSNNLPTCAYATKRMCSNLTDDVIFIAVKRSRMVVSTFSTTQTFDRALNALAQYTAGKAVKAIVNEAIKNTSV
mmetsp:Transcript_7531/g.8544  ORF Transcript_7531/g.8544 Transcript_7531/m.8544 type:complete len:819 (+) Transcript_7531:126-2582(+)